MEPIPAFRWRDAIVPSLLGAAGYALLELSFFVQRNLLFPWSASHARLAVLFFLLHAMVALAAAGLAAWVGRRLFAKSAPAFASFAPLATLVAVHAITHYRERVNALPRDVAGTAVSFGLTVLFFAGAWAHARALRSRPRLARVVAAGLGVALVVIGIVGVVTVRPIEEETAAVPARPSNDRLEAAPTGAKVLVFGFDGATWDVLDELIAEGRMPNLAALAARGRTMDVETIRPTFSPIIWTTVATGKNRFQHGIHDVIQATLPGGTTLHRSLERTAFLTKTTGVFFRFLYDRRLLRLASYRSSQVRVRSVFEAASEAGLGASRIEWFVSWPARPLSGVEVSDRFHLQTQEGGTLPGAVAPDSLNAALRPLLVSPEELGLDEVLELVDLEGLEPAEATEWAKRHHAFVEEMRINLARDLTTRNVAVDLLHRDPDWSLFGVYFRAVDVAHHLTWNRRRAAGDAAALDADPELRLRAAVDRYHEVMDAILGDVLAAAPPDAAILVLSDHGFEDRYGHSRAPRGFAIAAGAPFAPSSSRGTHDVHEVAPTLAAILGIPVADDLAARPRVDLLDPAFAAAHPVRSVTTWEREGSGAQPSGPESVLDGMDEAEVDRLRAIGYIQ